MSKLQSSVQTKERETDIKNIILNKDRKETGKQP